MTTTHRKRRHILVSIFLMMGLVIGTGVTTLGLSSIFESSSYAASSQWTLAQAQSFIAEYKGLTAIPSSLSDMKNVTCTGNGLTGIQPVLSNCVALVDYFVSKYTTSSNVSLPNGINVVDKLVSTYGWTRETNNTKAPTTFPVVISRSSPTTSAGHTYVIVGQTGSSLIYVEAVCGSSWGSVAAKTATWSALRSNYSTFKLAYPKGVAPIRPSTGRGNDFNGDGKDDIAWYERWNSSTITVASSSGSSFSGKKWLSGYDRPDWAGSGDFDGDGKTDVAWYEQWNNGAITVALSSGASFSNGSKWITKFGPPNWAGVGDFNGDGKDDIAWYERWNSSTITVLISTGKGFTQTKWLSGYGTPDWAGVGDFNGDGRDDIAWYEQWNNGAITVATSTGSYFTNGSKWVTKYGPPNWAGVGDFNGDGKDDIAWYERWNSSTITVASSSGSSFAGKKWLSGYGMPDWANVGDYNGDGKDDIAWYEQWNNGAITVSTSIGTSLTNGSKWVTKYGPPNWAS